MILADVPEWVKDRFWSKVAIGQPDECWPWMLIPSSSGYGKVEWNRLTGRGAIGAHRFAYALTHGDIPAGLTVDHMCRVRLCCNPSHLRLLTNAENASDNGWKRKTHCPKGHPYDEVNTYYRASGGRWCRTCTRLANARRKRANADRRGSGIA